MMSRSPELYQPQLVDEAEALLGVPFFFEDYDPFDYVPDAENLGLRQSLYRAACRLMAEARNAERKEAIKGDEGYDPESWNEQWQLTPRKIGSIALNEIERTDFLARQLYLANTAEEYITEHWNEICERLRPDQLEYILDIPHAIHRAPRIITMEGDDGNVVRYPVRGTTLVAPTGFGKTRLIETCVKVFQPGKKPKYSRTERPTRIGVVEPSLALTEQTADALQAALPDLQVGKLHQDSYQPHADVPVMTIEMFNAHFKDGMLAGEPLDLLIVDEGHRLSEPQFYKKVVEEWRGHTIALTATPAYDERRDVREMTSHTIEKRTIDDSMEEGVLNDASVYTFVVDTEAYEKLLDEYGLHSNEKMDRIAVRDAVDHLVVDFMKPLIEEGRRGIVFCEQGDDAYFARELARKLSETKLTDGSSIKAEAMYSAANNQREVIDKFHKGELQVITTVDTGREGLDASFDMVIVNCNIISQLRGRQIVGRGTRRSERFPTTVYGQFHIGDILDTQLLETPFSVEQTFGRGVLSQGREIPRRSSDQEEDPIEEPMNEGLALQFPFTALIQELLEKIDRQSIGETFIGCARGSRSVSANAVPLHEIIEGYAASEQYAKNKLRKAGFRWEGYYVEVDGMRRLVHHYSPEARDYLRNLLPVADMLSDQQVANLLNVPAGFVKYIANKEAINGRRVVRPKGKPARSFDKDEIKRLSAIIQSYPGVVSGSRPVQQVANELGVDSETTIWKLVGAEPEGRYQLKNMLWLTPIEIARAKETYDSIPMVEHGHKTIADMSRSTGVERNVIARNMTTEEHGAAVNRRYRNARGFLSEGKHWNADQVAIIEARVEKFRPRKLAAHLIPVSSLRRMVASIGVAAKEEWEGHLGDNGYAIDEMRITGLRTMNKCLSWAAVACLVEKYGRFKGRESVYADFRQLPMSSDDVESDKIAYAQSLQRELIANAELEEY